jgi:hypothetical protein
VFILLIIRTCSFIQGLVFILLNTRTCYPGVGGFAIDYQDMLSSAGLGMCAFSATATDAVWCRNMM